MSSTAPTITGFVATGWEPVRDAFVHNLAETEELGAGAAVYHRGECVVDLVGGYADVERTQPYTDDTLQLVFSTTKGMTAIAVALCVQRGLLDYDAPVSRYWPEFSAAGKGELTVHQVLSHQCGLVTVDGEVSLDEALAWTPIVDRIAAQAPLWEPGTTHGYHALTYGWLAGELVRRVDPAGRTLGAFVAEEIVSAVGGGAELWIGLPDAQQGRVSPIQPSPPPTDPEVIALMLQMLGPDTLGGRALNLNGAFALATDGFTWNRPEVRAAEIPGANGVTNARSLARVYAATIGEVDGNRLLTDATVARASARVTPEGEIDKCLHMPTTFGMGFMVHGDFTPMAGPGCFGHPGAGGSLAFADPGRGLGFASVMNPMAATLAGALRAQRLVDAAGAVRDS